ncbi:MAG: Rne/Rng family ribonuclease [Planctomycetota bacterium]
MAIRGSTPERQAAARSRMIRTLNDDKTLSEQTTPNTPDTPDTPDPDIPTETPEAPDTPEAPEEAVAVETEAETETETDEPTEEAAASSTPKDEAPAEEGDSASAVSDAPGEPEDAPEEKPKRRAPARRTKKSTSASKSKDTKDDDAPTPAGDVEMLINSTPGEETRIAVVRDSKLEDFYQERASAQSHVSNIYKGVVTNVEPAIQAAFVDFGLERNGFLHVSDLHPKYFPGKEREAFEKVGHKIAKRDRPPIQKCLKRGDRIVVQVLKEGLGTKGPTVTSYLSIPGRFLVMMPDMKHHGVSQKIEDDATRREMRDLLKSLNPPEEFGFIIRTAGLNQTKTDLKRDLAYLQRLWKSIEKQQKKRARTIELYAENDLVIRTIRDVFTPDTKRIVCDNLDAARRAHEFLSVANPRTKSRVVYYQDPIPLFHRHRLEQQIANISAREVPLPSGGALVFDQTEALVAIDVNSGKSRAARDAETNAYETNKEAVDEICRQLRLRDLGGLVVFDLIDMMQSRHRRAIENRIRNHFKKDRAKTRVGSISQFGMLEMTRQRMRPSLETAIYAQCKHCQGRGFTLSAESVLLAVMRRLTVAMQHKNVARLELTISPDVAFHLLNRKRNELTHLEETFGTPVLVRVGGITLDHIDIQAFNESGNALEIITDQAPSRLPKPDADAYLEIDNKTLEDLLGIEAAPTPDDADLDEEDDDAPAKPKRRRSRSRSRRNETDDTEVGTDSEAESAPDEEDQDTEEDKPRRRRRRRGGKGRSKESSETEENATDTETEITADEGDSASAESEAAEDASDKPKRRRRRRGGRGRRSTEPSSEDVPEAPESTSDEEPSEKPKRRTRSKPKTKAESDDDANAGDSSSAESNPEEPLTEEKPKRKPFRKRNAPPPPGTPRSGPVSTGYSNNLNR